MSESLQHTTGRLGELASAAGVYVDAYMALSLLEFGLGELLQRLPRLLPVVQTTVRAACIVLSCLGLAWLFLFVQPLHSSPLHSTPALPSVSFVFS